MKKQQDHHTWIARGLGGLVALSLVVMGGGATAYAETASTTDLVAQGSVASSTTTGEMGMGSTTMPMHHPVCGMGWWGGMGSSTPPWNMGSSTMPWWMGSSTIAWQPDMWWPGTMGSSTATSTMNCGGLDGLITHLTWLKIIYPPYASQIQGLITSLMMGSTTSGGGGTGTTTPPMTNPTGATVDQQGRSYMAGGTIDFGGRNFGHEENVTISLNGMIVTTAHADGGGNFSTGSLTLPSTPGDYIYYFTGQSSGDTIPVMIHVL